MNFDPTQSVVFMRDLEERYKIASGRANRAHYKIFYGQVRPAKILVLGINPAGDPLDTTPDGSRHLSGKPAAASATFYENDECDLLDCVWKENTGLKKLLVPLLNDDADAIRSNVVKTNVAFWRVPKVKGFDLVTAKDEAQPFLNEIIGVVRPQLVLLTSVDLHDFLERFAAEHSKRSEPIRDPGVKQIVFESAQARFRNCPLVSTVVRVAHASQFSWTYGKVYGESTIAQRVKHALEA